MLNPFPQGMGSPASKESTHSMEARTTGNTLRNDAAAKTVTPERLQDTPLYNSRIIDTYIKLLEYKYPWVNVSEILRHAGMTSYEIADQGHWFTQRQINRFHEKLSELTQNEHISREAGRYSASPDALGAMRQYVLGMVGPEKVFDIVGKTASNFTKSCKHSSRRIGPNKYEIEVSPFSGVSEEPFQCENRIGFFESVTLAFSNKLPRIEHPECIFKGGRTCRYQISWEASFSVIWKQIRVYIPLLFVLSCILIHFMWPNIKLNLLLLLSASLFFLLTLIGESLEKGELRKSLNNLKDSTDKLVEQITINYNNALMTNEIGQVISGKTKVQDVLAEVVKISERRLNYDRGIILLANPDRTRLEYRAAFGYSQESSETIKNASFRLDNPDSKGIFVVSLREQRPFLINDFNAIEPDLSSRSLDFARRLGAKSFICTPIVCDGESIGILAADNMQSNRPLVQSDISLLIGIAAIIGIAIRNTELIESKERQFSSILKVLAASIDARDPMTSGHSEKVTEYAVGICRELDLDHQYKEMIGVAALLHDYGKIGVPDAILKKSGRLTASEYETVKTHAAKTKTILQRVNFEGIFKEVPNIAGAHHERFDGKGYPEGLQGKQIPLGARIIAVADFFEAVTAERQYHDPLPSDQALELLRAKEGSHFDPEVVAAFIKHFFGRQTSIQPPKLIAL